MGPGDVFGTLATILLALMFVAAVFATYRR